MQKLRRKTELLAPAGNMEAFRGALNAGADAVYLAGQNFGARAYAGNFSEEELRDALQRAHLFGVRIYLTVNTLTRQEELAELTAFVRRMYEAGLDGVIVQDLGAAASIREACPGLELHASTQMSVTGPEAIRFLKRQGFVRVVPARELSLGEIRVLKEEGLEIESFIHGAMCYSYSGKCLLSSFLGGRSGNRGRCAGPCRLPYEAVGEDGAPLTKSGMCYPLSMKDMCALPILPKLLDAGIDSFKIEGRMKKPEYVAGTTAIYRKYIDRFYDWDEKGRPGTWSIDPEDLEALNRLYIRSDLCTGYYERRNGRDLVTMHEPGYRGADEALLAGIRERYLQKDRKARVYARAVITAGREAQLELTAEDGSTSVTATGPLVQEARSRALTQEDIAAKLGKTGNLPLEFAELHIETDGRSFLPVSALGELRRSAAEAYMKAAIPSGQNKNAAARDVGCREMQPEEQTKTAREDVSGQTVPPARQLIMVQTVPQARAALKWIAQAGKRTCAQIGRQTDVQIAKRTGAQNAAGSSPCGAYDRNGQYPYALILDAQALDASETLLQEIAGTEEKAGCRIPVLAALPYVVRESDRPWLEAFYAENRDRFYGFVTRSLEELEFLKEKEYDRAVLADSFLYAWNTKSLQVLQENAPKGCGNEEHGGFFRVLPAELDRKELQKTFAGALAGAVLPVYGRHPLMLSAGCIRKTTKGCLIKGCILHDRQNGRQSGKPGSRPGSSEGSMVYLRDRTEAMFPVRTDCRHCQNILYNSVPTSLHKSLGDALMQQCGSLLLSFTTEKPEEMTEILALFAGDTKAQAPAAYTTGHYRKGAL